MIVAVVNQKGGTGKTTTTVNLGSALAQLGKKVLLVDLDPQGNMGYSLGVVDKEHSVASLFTEDATFDQVLETREGMDILSSDISLADVELSLVNEENRESYLKSILAGRTYDFILVDCPPSLSLLTINALNAADGVLIPMQMEVLSLKGLDMIAETIAKVKTALNPSLEILGILPVMLDTRRKLSVEVYEHIRQTYDICLFESRIRTNVRASEAPSFGQSVLQYDANSNSAKDYIAFSKEFLNVVKAKK